MHHILFGWFFLVGRKCKVLGPKPKPVNVKLKISRIYTHWCGKVGNVNFFGVYLPSNFLQMPNIQYSIN